MDEENGFFAKTVQIPVTYHKFRLFVMLVKVFPL